MTTAPIPIPGAVSEEDFLYEDSDEWNSADGGGAVPAEVSTVQFAAGGGEELLSEECVPMKYICSIPHRCVIRRKPDNYSDVIEIREGTSEIMVSRVWGGWLCVVSDGEEGWTVSNSWHPAPDVATEHPRSTAEEEKEEEEGVPTLRLLSSSAPDPSGHVFMQSNALLSDKVAADLTTNLKSLDLTRGDEPTLRASIPVQRNLAYNSRRRYGKEDACTDDCMWLLAETKPAEGRDRDLRTREDSFPPQARFFYYGSAWEQFVLLYSQQQTLTVPSLLLKWLFALVGLLTYTLSLSKIHNISKDKKFDETLVACWATEVAAIIYGVLFLLGVVHSKLKGSFDFQFSYSALFGKKGVGLLSGSMLMSAAAATTWFLSIRWLPRDVASLGWSFHPLCVLSFAHLLGVKSKIGEKVGVATILLGAACSGISDLVGPDRNTVSTRDCITGGALSLCGGILFAVFLVLSTPLRKKQPTHSSHTPSGWSIPLLFYLLVISVASCLPLFVASVIFFTHSSGMNSPSFFGWQHLKQDIMAAGTLYAIGNAGLIGALDSLPPVVVSAVFALQPVLRFLSDLAVQNSDKGVPLPTRTVGGLCTLAGTICVCRSAVGLIAIIEATNSTASGIEHSRHPSGCSGCISRGPQSCPVHGIDTLSLPASTRSTRRPRRSRPHLPRVPLHQDFQIPTNRALQVQSAPEEEPTPRKRSSVC